ncbi:MAG: heme-copper oxidase subunit III, partial [Bacteroidia bacterium]
VLGLAFCVTQFKGWGELVENGIYFAGRSANPSGSFMYALTGLHLAHIFSAIVYLLILVWRSFAGKYASDSFAGVSNGALYWHFLDGLWIYLFVFLLFMQ